MKTITKYVNEHTGDEYTSAKECELSEKQSMTAKEMFSFVKIVKDSGCKFANGEYCIQRSSEYYNQLRDTIVLGIKKFDPRIARKFTEKNKDGLEVAVNFPFGIICRYLGDGASIVQDYFLIYQNICPKCYREWGQGYFALHCTHTDKAAEPGLDR